MNIERLIGEALRYLNYAGLYLSDIETEDSSGYLDEAYDYIILAIGALNKWTEFRRRG